MRKDLSNRFVYRLVGSLLPDLMVEILPSQQSLQQKSADGGVGVALHPAESAGNTHSLKRQKWQLKWQARRLKRKEQALGKSNGCRDKELDSSEIASAHTRHGVTMQQTLLKDLREKLKAKRNEKTTQKAAKRSRKSKADDEEDIGGSKRRYLEKKVDKKVKPSFHRASLKSTRRKSARGGKEERDFAVMVEKYREKLSRAE